MSSTAIIYAGIKNVSYGYSIAEAIQQGRSRIDLPCYEIFQRADKAVTIKEGILHEHCSILYNRHVSIVGDDGERLTN